MIGVINISISADNPQMPLAPFSAFVGSPSSVRVRNVPREIGAWKIEKVFVSANYPDNQMVSVEAKLVCGVWVATLAASAVAGQSANGFTISANGKDENGQPVVGYVLGRGDVFIIDADSTITPGETTHYIHVIESRPDSPRKGDAYVEDGVWWYYNGSAWTTLGGTFAGNGWAQYPISHGGDGKWHRVIIANGALAYDEHGFDEPPDAAPFALKSELEAEAERAAEAEQAKVPTDGDHTINGVKTFTQSPRVPTISSTDENSQKAASTGWVTAKLAAWWAVVKAALTKADVGLGNVDNTSDANKPVSTATQAALNAKANDNAVVKLTGEQVISGIKSFESEIVVSSSALRRAQANSYTYFHGGTSIRDGATITLAGSLYKGSALPAGGFNLEATDGKSETGEAWFRAKSDLSLSPNGYLKLIGFGPDMDPQVFGQQFAIAGMPSNGFMVLAIPDSGDTVKFSGGNDKAPYTGWMYIAASGSSAPHSLRVSIMKDATTVLFECYSETSSDETYARVFFPISRGQICKVVYSSGSESFSCRLLKSEAEVYK